MSTSEKLAALLDEPAYEGLMRVVSALPQIVAALRTAEEVPDAVARAGFKPPSELAGLAAAMRAELAALKEALS